MKTLIRMLNPGGFMKKVSFWNSPENDVGLSPVGNHVNAHSRRASRCVYVTAPAARAAPGWKPRHKPPPAGGWGGACQALLCFLGAPFTFPLVLKLAASRPQPPTTLPPPSLALMPSATLTLSLYNSVLTPWPCRFTSVWGCGVGPLRAQGCDWLLAVLIETSLGSGCG